MKTARSTTAVLLVILSVVALLAFLYATPFGRRSRRQALRGFRLAGNATGVFLQPALTVRMWGGTGERVLRIEVYDSGRVIVSGRQRTELQLAPDVAEGIVEIGRAALGDFNSSGCNTGTGGPNAELYLMIDGAWAGSVCRDSSEWPRGFETKRLFREIERHLPGVRMLAGEF
jgi:hypothetical protein